MDFAKLGNVLLHLRLIPPSLNQYSYFDSAIRWAWVGPQSAWFVGLGQLRAKDTLEWDEAGGALQLLPGFGCCAMWYAIAAGGCRRSPGAAGGFAYFYPSVCLTVKRACADAH